MDDLAQVRMGENDQRDHQQVGEDEDEHEALPRRKLPVAVIATSASAAIGTEMYCETPK